MRICEYNFLDDDPDSPGYSHAEVDYYAWIPFKHHSMMPNHRLSLRKNLVSDEYETYRAYHLGTTVQRIKAVHEEREETGIMITHTPSGIEEVAFKSKDLQEILEWGNREWNRWHGAPDYEREPDELCLHTGVWRETAVFCPVEKGLVNPENPKPWR